MPNSNNTRLNRIIYSVLGVGFVFFTGLVYTSAVPAAPTQSDALAMEGKMLWQEYNCSSCHQLYGLGGYLGPDLTNVISDKRKGRAFAAAIMKSGTKVMPDFKLSDHEINALLAFLEHTDQSGKNGVHYYNLEPDGTVSEKGEGRQ